MSVGLGVGVGIAARFRNVEQRGWKILVGRIGPGPGPGPYLFWCLLIYSDCTRPRIQPEGPTLNYQYAEQHCRRQPGYMWQSTEAREHESTEAQKHPCILLTFLHFLLYSIYWDVDNPKLIQIGFKQLFSLFLLFFKSRSSQK